MPSPPASGDLNNHSELSSGRTSRTSMLVFVLQPYIPGLKFEGLPIPKIWLIFGHGIYPSGDLEEAAVFGLQINWSNTKIL